MEGSTVEALNAVHTRLMLDGCPVCRFPDLLPLPFGVCFILSGGSGEGTMDSGTRSCRQLHHPSVVVHFMCQFGWVMVPG